MAPTVTPLRADESALAQVRYDERGLVPAIVQEAGTGAVLMLAWMNEDTLRRTLAEGRTVFWSRSRQEVWAKGETSGD
ncbi:MAG TPA: phosphoribosyl-AMP cyclohydrolase, partial [Acidimicrobiales bacterium]|nr:phosphoribosyl-AMP cyclohydrolase [Acidimicrobiales bacterium]